MADTRDTKVRCRTSKGKGVVKEKKAPRRGMGVARLERMRLLEQRNSMEEDLGKKARTPLFSSFLPLSYLLHRFPEVDAVRGTFEELAWYRSIGQWQSFDSFATTTSCLKRKEEIHAIPRDLTFTSIGGENSFGNAAASFAVTRNLDGNEGDNSECSDTCLDLSLSTVHRRYQKQSDHFKGNISCIQGEVGAAAGMSRAALTLELELGLELAMMGRGDKGEEANSCRRSSSCTTASPCCCCYGGEEEASISHPNASLASPSLQLTLGRPFS